MDPFDVTIVATMGVLGGMLLVKALLVVSNLFYVFLVINWTFFRSSPS